MATPHPSRTCDHCGEPIAGRTKRARYCGPPCRRRAFRARRAPSRSVPSACLSSTYSDTRTERKSPDHPAVPRRPRCNAEAVLWSNGRCLGCGLVLGQVLDTVRAGTTTCSSRCRSRVHKYRRSTHWPRAELLAAAWGLRPRDFWRTPPELFGSLDAVFGFGLDCASAGDDALCDTYITPELDALKVSWRDRCPPGQAAFVNPPYSPLGGGLLAWVEKAIAERDAGLPVVMLIPPDPSTRYHQLVREEAVEERCSKRRLSFLHPDTGLPKAGNRGASMVVPFLPGHRGPATATFLGDPWTDAVAEWAAGRMEAA